MAFQVVFDYGCTQKYNKKVAGKNSNRANYLLTSSIEMHKMKLQLNNSCKKEAVSPDVAERELNTPSKVEAEGFYYR